jgi:ABC-type Fe3+-hydroxamate transport system substrate-binding protein
MKEKLDDLHDKNHFTEVIHGAAQGADRLAGVWARWNNIKESPYPADWKQYGSRAGYVRNTEMLEKGKPDMVIAFKGGKGTNMMVELAEKANVPTIDCR